MDAMQLTAADGASIWMYRWLPGASPRGVILIVHGLSEHGQRYAPLAQDLTAAGFAVYAYDQRGHGAHAEQLGWIAESGGWNKLVTDLGEVRHYLSQAHPAVPLTLFGHSMGSLVSRAYFLWAGSRISAMVLSSTSSRQGASPRVLRGLARLCGKISGMRSPNTILARMVFGTFNLTFRPRRTRADWLTRDAAQVDLYLADPLCAQLPTSSMWADLFGGMLEIERAEKHPTQLPADCPVLLLAGSRDPVSLGNWGLKQLARRYRAAGVNHVDIKVYPGARHEMHHETNRAEYVRDLVAWLVLHAALPEPDHQALEDNPA